MHVLGPCGLSNELSCEAGSFFGCCNSHKFLQPEVLRLYFSGLHGLYYSPVVNLGLSALKCGTAPVCQLLPCQPQSSMYHLACPVLQLLLCCASSPPWLPISAPATSLNECFFLHSLVIRLPYSSVFWQFWLFFVFKFVLSFFWLYEVAKCIYLCCHLGRKSKILLFNMTYLSIMTYMILRVQDL